MKSLIEQLTSYNLNHTKFSTHITHMIGIPLTWFSYFIILGWIHITIPHVLSLGLSWLVIIAMLVYYFLLDYKLGAAMTVLFVILNLIAQWFSLQGPTWLGFKIFLITFIIGWIFQFIGHLLEGKKPELFNNPFQLIVGPIAIMAQAFFLLGYRQDLRMKLTP